MSLEMYEKLKLKNLDSTSIPHVVGASGESLGARGKTKCEININGKIFYQTFIVSEHLKRPIILGRDFSIQNCIGISWTKTNTRRLTQFRRIPQVPQSHNSETTRNLRGMGRPSMESHSSIKLFAHRIIRTSTILPDVRT